MELKVFRDTLSAAGSFCTVKSEIPIETEILISDYLPQVFKIVKCFMKMVVLQKQFQAGRLTLDGYLRCVVYYQGEDGEGLCQTEQKVPFTKVLETPQFEFSTWSASVGGETEYLNCRAVNQRRVEVRGAFAISASVYTQVQQEIISAVSDCGIQQRQLSLAGVRSVASIDKLITTENEFSFATLPSAVLDITGEAEVKELKVISGKAVVKGEIVAEIAYRTGDAEMLHAQRVPLSFHQILDIDGIAEDCECLCAVEPVGFTMHASADEGEQTQLSVSALLHLRALRHYEIASVADAFSTTYESDVTQGGVNIETFERALDELVTVQVGGQLPDERASLVACFVNMGAAEMIATLEKPVLHAKGVVTVFCKNSLDELESYDKGIELNLPIAVHDGQGDLHLESWLNAENISCAFTGGQLEVTVGVRVRGMLLCRHTLPSVSQIAIGAPLEPEDPEVSLRIYYAGEGEAVFDIARRFHVSPSDMMCANDLESETLAASRRLLVPGVG